MSKGYFIRVANRPFCDHTACMAGMSLASRAGVTQCSYRTRRDALTAMRRLNGVDGYAGIASIHEGPCPSIDTRAPKISLSI
jgi:hypothetical protein